MQQYWGWFLYGGIACVVIGLIGLIASILVISQKLKSFLSKS